MTLHSWFAHKSLSREIAAVTWAFWLGLIIYAVNTDSAVAVEAYRHLSVPVNSLLVLAFGAKKLENMGVLK